MKQTFIAKKEVRFVLFCHYNNSFLIDSDGRARGCNSLRLQYFHYYRTQLQLFLCVFGATYNRNLKDIYLLKQD